MLNYGFVIVLLRRETVATEFRRSDACCPCCIWEM